MALQVYNSLTRRKEAFEPIDPPHVGMYVCGPTVYGDAHLGHAKSYISFDVVLRYLRYLGYEVRYVQNITDVGHLTEDQVGMADEGEDKLVREASRRHIHPMQLAEQFTRSYFEDMDALNCLRPDISPRASGHICEQIEHVQRLLERGHAYEVNGSVYFDVAGWAEYGRLSGRQVDQMQAGARVAVNEEKRHPADFALWKRAEPGHIMQWPSPWGRGFPGWHIECTVMSQKYIGETLDIHGGGLENQFPHHECEIAQAEAATGKPFTRYFLHNNMVTVEGTKMGKSLGNFITLKQVFEGHEEHHEKLSKKYDPLVVRFLVLQSHYRSPLDFSDTGLQAAEAGYQRLTNAVLSVRKALAAAPAGEPTAEVQQMLGPLQARFGEAMDDDFNAPVALAVLFDLVTESNKLVAGGANAGSLQAVDDAFRRLGGDALGIVPDQYVQGGGAGAGDEAALVELLIETRAGLRAARQFALADAVRDKLTALGIQLEDGPQGTTWKRTSAMG
jgi:cysteinyl-tRNA synthetase